MRVFVVTSQWPKPNLPSCGIMVVRQVDSLRSEGVDTTVLSFAGPTTSGSWSRGLRGVLVAALEVLRLNVAKKQFDVVHAHAGHGGALACLQFRIPVVVSYVGYDLDVISEDEALRRKAERLAFRFLAALVAVPIVKSRRALERLPSQARARATVLPNGVNRDLFRPIPRADARRALGWSEEPVVLFAADPGRPVKRVELAEAAVAEVTREFPDARLVVCNEVPPDEVPLWMNAADVLLLTSFSESSPNVVKEAMACNLPVVSVDVGDVREVVEGARNCHMCEPDPAALGRAVAEVLSALPERSDGRERTLDLDEGAIAKRLRDVYESAIGRGPGPLGFVSLRKASASAD